MTIQFSIDADDFLTHQLFIASRSTRIQKKRRKSQVILPLIYVTLGLIALVQSSIFLAILFFMVAVLWYFIYPLWERQHYVKHYKEFIAENYKNRLGQMATVDFSDDFILAKDNVSESKVLTKEIEEICEIPSLILIKLTSGPSFVLPKNKIANCDSLQSFLQRLAHRLNIKYEVSETWEWK